MIALTELCERCGDEIKLRRGDTGPSIDYYGTCGTCFISYTRLKDARTGKETHHYYNHYEKESKTDGNNKK
jgi:hypothetical protein